MGGKQPARHIAHSWRTAGVKALKAWFTQSILREWNFSALSLDAPTLAIANPIISASTVGLLLIARFGLGASGNRMNGWIAGEGLLFASRLGFPFVWLLTGFGWQLPIEKVMPPLAAIGLSWHVGGLRQSRIGTETTNWRIMGISVARIGLASLVGQPLPEWIRLKVYVASQAVV